MSVTICTVRLQIFLQLQAVNKELTSKFESCLGSSPSRVEILHYLLQHEEVAQSALQKEVNIDAAAVTRHLKQLEAAGTIVRYRKEDNQRATWVKLEAEAKRQIEHSYQEKSQFVKDTLAGFSEEELEQFLQMLDRVSENVSRVTKSQLGGEHK
ncbi:MarR family winged helix-turn-helix transcriptional regulator [Alkalicoccobacillus porphyridii]|uniref:MarR family transcriptional regulator n=1 Tax=Alkalicoccobacillus porphyridii TaxID=2597270 RepID=A0A554A2P4_9BACI|nr:MarR family transcriptional regulator [Alkalicoccobacillus porphyridii]TSB47935.1 MarR family transcriptional regulator [Alkalicoccobacillus porphyridii]